MFDNQIMKDLDGLSKEEQLAVLRILQEYSSGDSSSTYNKILDDDYDEIPVDIHTFMHNKTYLGNALYDNEGRFTIFPYWEEKLKDIFPTNIDTRYNTIVFTGAIGLGKSTIAVICQLYMLYRLLCLKDPYLYYGLQPIDKITISLMNITLENAKGVALDKMNQMILSSEWFMSHGEMHGTTNLEYRPNKHIELITASSNNQVIGRALFCNFTDEVNFGLTNDVEKLKKKQKTLISQVDARMKSRFLRGTYLPTLNIIASSKNKDQSFLEDFIQSKVQNESKNTLIVDEPQWVVDDRKNTKEKFFVAVGNKFLANEVLPVGCSALLVDEYRARGYSILEVPMGYYENFMENIDDSLADIAGIATASSLKFISGMKLNECISSEISNPFTKEIIEVGDSQDDKVQYWDFFDMSKVPADLKARPLYIHLDMSVSGDKTGIAGTWITQKRYDADVDNQSKSLFYQLAFSVAVKAPKGAQISFEKNKRFVYWLRDQGFNVKKVTTDTYQSAPVLQDLRAHNFDCEILSVDRLTGEGKNKICEPYHYLRSTIYDKRIKFYKTSLLTDELIGLEKLSDGHIDHTTSGINSKDIADAVCGSTFEASKHADEYAYDYGENLDIVIENNSDMTHTMQVEQITLDFEEELKLLKPQPKPQQSPQELDFGFGPAVPYTSLISDGIMVW